MLNIDKLINIISNIAFSLAVMAGLLLVVSLASKI